ncbi:MAG: hypothetical protein ACRYGP_06195 [Janthinobacterium lividum]
MTDRRPDPGFAAFRETVFDDVHLLSRLRASRDRAAHVAAVVAEGAARGFRFDEAAVWAALRAGEQTWLRQGDDVP